ncbi:MAG: precorrin-3B C(17)-methyltransferase [Oscillospiraceae bacterium]|nr:precorrin-3B C(17)-methyltransferase [Oscillospiraceae bacterium]
MKLWIVGIGPGDAQQMTQAAKQALEQAECIVGYSVYTQLVQPLYPHKTYLSTAMTGEVERCRMAIEQAVNGTKTAVVCSGDSGVYGMAALCCQLAEKFPSLDIEVVAGVTAALSGGALLGAPLTHDFAVISLSDLLTPYELIQRRIEAAASADFVLVLYNPSSKKRADYLRQACQLVLRYRSADTVCGVVRSVGRDGEEKQLFTLGELQDYKADMFTTVFIGNSQTIALHGRMVTPRGYSL